MGVRESQNLEFKESWREECLKTICAFANTDGGTMYVGENDRGKISGVPNYEKLLEDIPNQIKNSFGILPDVKVVKANGKTVIAVKVKTSIFPISYKGKFYKRSGSITQGLNGPELQSFLLQKSNLSWEAVIEEDATLKDIDPKTIQLFKKLSKERFPQASSEKSILALLEKLHLAKNRKLTRAAILLFGKSPQSFFPHSYIKIARFKNDESIISMDEVKGNLFTQVGEALDKLRTKYLDEVITIDALQRKEKLEFPEVSLREAIVNAIVHRDYMGFVTQIKVYPNTLSIWNNGELTNKLTLEKLLTKHPSFPRNQLIADVFFQAGFIEQWGHGTVKIINECRKASLPDPIFELAFGGIQVTFLKDILEEDYLRSLALSERQINAVMFTKDKGRITNIQYQELNQTSKRTATNDLQDLTKKGILLKIGATGKGTFYVLQRGNVGAK